jgi:hypothetical protein
LGAGKECEGSQKETAPCNAELCDAASEANQDCQWAPWSQWGACSATCDGGETKRYRYVSKSARNYGKECLPEDSRQVRACNMEPCGTKLFCVWADWGAYTPCSTSCGAGTKKRSRALESSHTAPVGEALDTTYLAIAGVTLSGPSVLALSGSAGFAAVIGTVMLARRLRRSSYTSVQE